jgi:ficolin
MTNMLVEIFAVLLMALVSSPTGLACSQCYKHLPRNCQEVYASGCRGSGVYTIDPGCDRPFQVYCNMDGQYTVFQRRMDGSVNFYRDWDSYVEGFGDPEGEYWLGLDRLHCLTTRTASTELSVHMKAFDGSKATARYAFFSVGNPGTKYRLNVGGYSGTGGDSLASHNNQSFSTRDEDNDAYDGGNCAVTYSAAWWYVACHASNLNGLYLSGGHTSYANGVNWRTFKTYHHSFKFVEMGLRAA